jgi:hypothetical protein
LAIALLVDNVLSENKKARSLQTGLFDKKRYSSFMQVSR